MIKMTAELEIREGTTLDDLSLFVNTVSDLTTVPDDDISVSAYGTEGRTTATLAATWSI